MARLSKSQVVFRWRFGQGAGKGRARWDNTARAIAQNVAFSYAEDSYDTMRKMLEQRVEMDVRAELVHLARLYRRHIIGAGGTTTRPSGYMDTVSKGSQRPVEAISGSLPDWAPRNAQYLRRKRAATGGIRWFDNRGWRTYKGQKWKPKNSGLLFREMRADSWETIFGPIRVRFFRKRQPTMAARSLFPIAGQQGEHVRVQIGSIRVQALGKITPSMLPGFTSGHVMASAAGNPGLIGLVAAYDPQLAMRLGRMRNGIYRPTLEPFLGFFLTKALPFAVQQRLVKQGMGSVIRSAGRR